MRFEVVAATTPADPPLQIDPTTNLAAGIDAPLIPFGSSAVPPRAPVRQLSLNETFDDRGRLIQMLGTLVPPGAPDAGLGRSYESPVTEQVSEGDIEVWEIFNLTADVHPMHFHLVNVQLINRQPFQSLPVAKKPRRGASRNINIKQLTSFIGPATPAQPNETGWKETVMMFPGTVTRIIMQFTVPQIRKAQGGVVPTPVQSPDRRQ